MSGTKAGGIKAAITNKQRHGNRFFQEIGRKGGTNGHTGGFASNPSLAREAGRKGGRTSVRGSSIASMVLEPRREEIQEMYDSGLSMQKIADSLEVSVESLRKWAKYAIDGYDKEWTK